MSISQKILYAFILLFIVTLLFPLWKILNVVAVILLVLCSLSLTSWQQKVQLIKERSYIWWMLAFGVVVFISVLRSDNKHAAFRYLDPQLALFYFPLTIGLLQLKNDFRNKVLLGIAMVIAFFAIIFLCFGIYRSVTLNNTEYLYNDSLTVPLVGQQSIYISLMVNFAIYIFAYFLFYQPAVRKYRGILVIAILLLFIISFLLASRNMMLMLYGSTMVFAFYYIFKRKKYLEGITLIMGLLIGVFLVFKFFPKTINRFKELTYTQFNYQQNGLESHYNMEVTAGQWNGANTRLAVWQCGWQLFKQNPWLGVNIGDKKEKLMEVFRQKNFQFAIRTGKNVHNNYLDILMSLGITGLAFFLLGWIILPIRLSFRQKDGLSLVIILTLAFAMVTEIYLDRSLGGMLIGFFIPFLHSDKPTKN